MDREPLAVGGIVLCGGHSTRMQRPKEWLPFGGEALLQRMVRVVGEAVRPVIVAARRGQVLPTLPQDVEIVYDAVEDFGPLAGVAAGLDALLGRCTAAVVVTCDHPLVSSEVLRFLIEHLRDEPAVVLRDGEHVYPLLGVYRLSTRAILADLVARGEHRARRFAEACPARLLPSDLLREVDPDLSCLRNVNDPDDYQAVVRAVENVDRDSHTQ